MERFCGRDWISEEFAGIARRSTIAADRVTLDTNILIYAIDRSAGARHEAAGKIVLRAAAARQPLMLQCLNEVCAVVKRKRLATAPELEGLVRFHREAFSLVPPSVEDLSEALRASEEHGLPFWDAMLWATARRAGCRLLLSEDFQDGRELGGVRFVNPFRLTTRELKTLMG